jgi:hypothetical protein
LARYGIFELAPKASSKPGLERVIRKTCLTRPAFGVLVSGVFVGVVLVALGALTGRETGPPPPPPPPFTAVTAAGVDAGVVAAGVLGDEPPTAASA